MFKGNRDVPSYSVFLSFFALGLLLVMAGCDTVESEPEYEVEPAAFSFEVDYFLDELEFVGTVAAATYDAPEFTPSVVRDGAVLAYFRDLEDMWTAMPFTYGVESEEMPAVDYTATFAYAYEHGRLDLFLESSSEAEEVHDAIRDSDLFLEPLPVKIVVIPGGRQVHARVDVKSFEAVQAAFDID